MTDCPASYQSATRRKKITMLKLIQFQTELTQSGIFFGPVKDCNDGYRNGASISFLDANAQLCWFRVTSDSLPETSSKLSMTRDQWLVTMAND
jgi:hypothetical protein